MKKQVLGALVSAVIAGTSYACYSAFRKLTKAELRQKILQQITQCYNTSAEEKFVEPFQVQKTYSKNEQGIEFHIKLVQMLAKKPVSNPKEVNPLMQPFQPGQLVMKLGKFNLLLNKYPVNPYHTLLVPQTFIHQTEPFTKEYLGLAYDVLRAVEGFAFFNSHPEAGASLQHKHVQIVPQSAFQSANVLNHINNWAYENSVVQEGTFLKLRFIKKVKHFIQFFDIKIQQTTNENEQNEILYKTYISLLKQCGVDIHLLGEFKHNLIITSEYMMIVVRKSSSYNGIALNAVGFTGSLLAKSEEECEKLKNLRIGEILENLAESDENFYQNVKEC